MEPPKGKLIYRQEKIKDILGDIGIAGETVIPSAARTIEELTQLGVMKGYSTIVAVGGESLINKIINILATQKISKEAVLGIIPNDFESLIARKINVGDLRSACNALKFRRLETIDICQIEPNKFFITEAMVENPKNRQIYFSLDTMAGSAQTNQIIIKPGLNIYMHDKALEGNAFSRFVGWLLSRKEKDIFSSFFQTKKVRFESENANLPIKVSGEIIAKTPATFYNRPRMLKIIVARDKMKQS